MAREALVRVYADTKGHGSCRACDAPLTWYETVAGKRLPCEEDPVPRRSEHDAEGRLVLVLSADDVHWRLCPRADQFRRAR